MFISLKKLMLNVCAFSIDELGTCVAGEFEIELTSKIPVHMNPYRKAAVENKAINDEVCKMLSAGIIQYSKSAYSGI
jgi:hypothetical protein